MSARTLLGRLGWAAAPPAVATEADPPLLELEGFCPVCDRETRFRSWTTWLRDGLICIHCHSLPRERAFFTVLERVLPGWRELRIHESSPSHPNGKLARECPGYQPSHYDPAAPLGSMSEAGWRNEDLERQTFPDESFDLVVTQDVFEHLFEPGQAIREIARTLRPGGLHVATAPLVRKADASTRRARRLPDGAIEHLEPADHHDNPIDPGGSLVTVDWGYDIADFLDAQAGLNTTIWSLDDPSRGIQGELLDVLVSRKASPPAL